MKQNTNNGICYGGPNCDEERCGCDADYQEGLVDKNSLVLFEAFNFFYKSLVELVDTDRFYGFECEMDTTLEEPVYKVLGYPKGKDFDSILCVEGTSMIEAFTKFKAHCR